ncbi:hypothetical protein [Erythrobacter aureus]|uniref:Uncharacterized protein n=1 Tax=Erythrobacter aureus TaxID=2182384 RepID=A0A345YJ69_9SPHN|nr:hypothetical protein [Erythrobacter aureus]AXK43971.1 hypothetical protein DVR09_16075 [Erythrobacter aureus]
MEVRIHPKYTAKGFLACEEVKSVLYWATRLSDAIEDVQKYERPREMLLAIIWDHFRVLDANRNAVSDSGIIKMVRWCDKNLAKFSDKYAQERRELRDAMRNLLVSARAADMVS